jgi:hypothetical protein
MIEMETTCTECDESWPRTPRHRQDCDVMLHPKKWGVDKRDYQLSGGLWWKKYDHKHGYTRAKHNAAYQKMDHENHLCPGPNGTSRGNIVLNNIRFEVDLNSGTYRVRPIWFSKQNWVNWFYAWDNGEWISWKSVFPHEPPDLKRYGFSDIIDDFDVVMPWANVEAH